MTFTAAVALMTGAGAIGSGVSLFLSRKLIRAISRNNSPPSPWLVALGPWLLGTIPSSIIGIIVVVCIRKALEYVFSFSIPPGLYGATFVLCVTAMCAGLLTWLFLKAIEYDREKLRRMCEHKTPAG